MKLCPTPPIAGAESRDVLAPERRGEEAGVKRMLMRPERSGDAAESKDP